MAPTSRSPFTAPGEQGRGLWRALAEATGGGLLMLLTLRGAWGLGDSLPGAVQLVLGTAILALLTVRRRYPTTSLIGLVALMGVLPAAAPLTAVTAYTTAKQLVAPRRRNVVLLASTVLSMLSCTTFALGNGLGSHSFGLALGAMLAATAVIVPGLVGTAGGQQDRLLQALRERTAAAEETRRLADSESRIHERSRIAAEMHDLVGHRLSLISLHAGGLEMALQKESPELRDEAALVRRATGDAMRELREVLGVLGPLGRDTGTGALTDATGTRSDIEALAEESRRGGIPVDLTWDGPEVGLIGEGPDLDVRAAQVRRAVHRVVRECLTNVHRYAAGAHVTVTVTHTDDRVAILVRNGVPPVPPQAASGLGSGRGLTGLRERVALLGGTLEAKPTPAGGFAVTAEIPAEPDPGVALAVAGAPPYEPSHEPLPGHSLSGVQRRVVSALTGLLGFAGLGVMMAFGLFLVGHAKPQPVYGETRREEPRIGMSREKIEEDARFRDDHAVRAAATGREPAHPESVTSCIYPMVSLVEDFVPVAEDAVPEATEFAAPLGSDGRPGYLNITRYCFRGDKLAAIDRFTVPMVSQTPPWEAP